MERQVKILGSTQIFTSQGFRTVQHLVENSGSDLNTIILATSKKGSDSMRMRTFQTPLAIEKANKLRCFNLESQKVNLKFHEELSSRVIHVDGIEFEDKKFVDLSTKFKFKSLDFGLYSRNNILDIYEKYGDFEDSDKVQGLFEDNEEFALGYVLGYLLYRSSLKGTRICFQIKSLDDLKIFVSALDVLQIPYEVENDTNENGNLIFYIKIIYSEILIEHLFVNPRDGSYNNLLVSYEEFTRKELLGLYFGITHRAAWPNWKRNFQYVYAKSQKMVDLVQYLGTVFSMETHLNRRDSRGKDKFVCCINFHNAISMKFKKDSVTTFEHNGPIYSVPILEDSWLIARGNSYSFSVLVR